MFCPQADHCKNDLGELVPKQGTVLTVATGIQQVEVGPGIYLLKVLGVHLVLPTDFIDLPHDSRDDYFIYGTSSVQNGLVPKT